MNILDLVGNTPLLALKKIAPDLDEVEIFAKAEFTNPSGSIKDRAAKAMLLDGIKKGLLTKDKIIADATSGNTGISYAMLGAALGFKVQLFMPKNASLERKRIIKSFGAQIIETSPLEGSDGAYLKAKETISQNPDLYFYPDQYNNPINPQTHFYETGNEILTQTQNKITHFIASMGTSGSFMGISKRLKTFNPFIKTIAVQPDSPLHGIEGTKEMSSTIKPGIFDESLIDGIIKVSTQEAYEMTRRLAREEGIFVGISSGANVAAAIKLAKTVDKFSIIVTLLCDSGNRYTSDSFWDE